MTTGKVGLKWIFHVIQLAVIAAFLGGSTFVAWKWISNPPKARRKRPGFASPLVSVVELKKHDRDIEIFSLGTVKASRKISITPLVGGKINWVNPRLVPGEVFSENERLLKIGASEYFYALKSRKSDVVKAQADLKLELGKQTAAEKQYGLISDRIKPGDKTLLLRKPQEKQARAVISSAKAQVNQAYLNINRTNINAPFYGMIVEKYVDKGSTVGTSTVCVTYAGIDRFWIETLIPGSELKNIVLPDGKNPGSEVEIYDETAWGKGVHRKGRVIKLLPELESESKQVKILIEVLDPLDLKKSVKLRKPLLAQSVVTTLIRGRKLNNVYEIPRTAVHEDKVWLALNGRLEIRKVKSVWRNSDSIFVRNNLRDGEKLILTNLGNAVDKMKIRTKNPETSGGSK
ncbi:MAG: efflux RND transporter periplasmic adaptor subunit [Deltaproteobacteria bacterium]|nr:efflux RND transporter periplasmic adaptor subunit [Deltaproteobacteria bacterium]